MESASLAMDTEEGVEVVWNEVLFSDKKVFKGQEVKNANICTARVLRAVYVFTEKSNLKLT